MEIFGASHQTLGKQWAHFFQKVPQKVLRPTERKMFGVPVVYNIE